MVPIWSSPVAETDRSTPEGEHAGVRNIRHDPVADAHSAVTAVTECLVAFYEHAIGVLQRLTFSAVIA